MIGVFEALIVSLAIVGAGVLVGYNLGRWK